MNFKVVRRPFVFQLCYSYLYIYCTEFFPILIFMHPRQCAGMFFFLWTLKKSNWLLFFFYANMGPSGVTFQNVTPTYPKNRTWIVPNTTGSFISHKYFCKFKFREILVSLTMKPIGEKFQNATSPTIIFEHLLNSIPIFLTKLLF